MHARWLLRSGNCRAVAVPPVRKAKKEEDHHDDDSEHAGEASPASATTPSPQPLLQPGPLRPVRAVWRLSRPHTIIGSALCIPALTAYSATTTASLLSPLLWCGALYALVPALLMNLFIVGLNQLTDVEIDKINKPYLPLASGDLSMRSGTVVVCSSLAPALR